MITKAPFTCPEFLDLEGWNFLSEEGACSVVEVVVLLPLARDLVRLPTPLPRNLKL
jgi:hypothetical protein